MIFRVDGRSIENFLQWLAAAERRDEEARQQNIIEAAAGPVIEMALGAVFARGRVTGAAPAQQASGPLTFTNDKPNIPPGTGRQPPSPDAGPAEAAVFIDFYARSSLSPGADGFMFLRQLMEHQSDPAWIQGFFRALGTERTAELIDRSLSPETFLQWTDRGDINEFVGVLRNSFATLDRAGLLNQADMDKLVGRWAASGEFNPQVVIEIFGKLPYQHEQLKTMFFRAAAREATAPRVDEDLARTLAAAATHVLGSTSSDNQVAQLDQLRRSGQLEQLIRRGMAGESRVTSLDSMAVG